MRCLGYALGVDLGSSCIILHNMLINERISAPTSEGIAAILEEEGVT